MQPRELKVLETGACCTPDGATLMDTDAAEILARALKAMGHPIRVQIMHILSEAQGRVCVCDIEGHFDIKQPTVSHHLRSLRDAGLVEAEQRGLYMHYRIRPRVLAFVRDQLARIAGA